MRKFNLNNETNSKVTSVYTVYAASIYRNNRSYSNKS